MWRAGRRPVRWWLHPEFVPAGLQVHDEQHTGADIAATHLGLLDAEHIGVGRELHIIKDTHRRHDKAHLACELAPERLDLVGQAEAAVVIDERQEAIAEFKPELVKREGRADRLFRRHSLMLGFLGGDNFGSCFFLPLVADGVCHISERTAKKRERNEGDAGHQAHAEEQRGGYAKRTRITAELAEQRLIGTARNARFGHKHTGGGRHNQRRNLGDKAVTHRQDGVLIERVRERNIVDHYANDDATNDVDERDEDTGDGVPAYKFGRTVHGTEEGAFVLKLLAADLGFGFVDQAGRHVGVDCHLFTGHGVQAEARRHFGDTAGTLGDHHEVHDNEDREHDDTDHDLAAHQECAKGFNHRARGVRAGVPFR